ncbi:MAG: hypothetical protein AAFP03_13800, partial [Cyanobacteria bacterium J06598_3]
MPAFQSSLLHHATSASAASTSAAPTSAASTTTAQFPEAPSTTLIAQQAAPQNDQAAINALIETCLSQHKNQQYEQAADSCQQVLTLAQRAGEQEAT